MTVFTFFPGALVIGVVRCRYFGSTKDAAFFGIITSVELRSRGASQAISLLCLKLAQESGLCSKKYSRLQLQSARSIIAANVHTNFFPGALIRQNTVFYSKSTSGQHCLRTTPLHVTQQGARSAHAFFAFLRMRVWHFVCHLSCCIYKGYICPLCDPPVDPAIT